MSTSYRLHRLARRLGDAEAITRGRLPARLARRMVYRILFRWIARML